MRTNYPQVRCMMQDEKNVELAAAFCAPFTIDSPFRPNSLRQTAAKRGKNIIVYEGGESLRMDAHAIEEGINGTLRLMPRPRKRKTGLSGTRHGPAHARPACFNLPLNAVTWCIKINSSAPSPIPLANTKSRLSRLPWDMWWASITIRWSMRETR